MDTNLGSCSAYSKCLNRPALRCAYQSPPIWAGGPHEQLPCMARLCGRLNHRFCEYHHPEKCRSRTCDQPSFSRAAILIPFPEPNWGTPAPDTVGFNSERCTLKSEYRRRQQDLVSRNRCRSLKRLLLDEVTIHKPLYYRTSAHYCPPGITSSQRKRGTGKCVGTQAQIEPTLASRWLRLETMSACIISAKGATIPDVVVSHTN